MKKTLKFSKGFLPCAILSIILIVGGIVSAMTRGINFGLDFKPGMIETVVLKGDHSSDEVRSALSSIQGASVKELGSGENKSFQIRSGDEEGIQDAVNEALNTAFGAENVEVVASDFIGSQFSKSLMKSSFWLVLMTLVLIWVYATFRFHWDFALAAVVAIIHDSLIMVAFVSWTQVEFSTTTLAAILTIIGYSINATVVILDRVRSSMKINEASNFTEILNIALTATLGRSILTTVTTLFAVLSLFFFTTGSIHDFALVLSIGLVSGAYSSMFISSGIIALARRRWTPGSKGVGPAPNGNVLRMQ